MTGRTGARGTLFAVPRVLRARRGGLIRATGTVLAALTLAGCAAGSPAATTRPAATAGTTVAVIGAPALRVRTVRTGLADPTDIAFLPGDSALVSQRRGGLVLLTGLSGAASARPVRADLSDLDTRGGGGLLGVVTDPDFALSRRITTCQSYHRPDGYADLRLIVWQLAADGGSLTRVGEPLVTGLPADPGAGGSGSATGPGGPGCVLVLAPDGTLLVGTGDANSPRAAQDLGSPGGKVLRVDLVTGGPPPANPFTAADPVQRLVWTFGHHDVRGIAVRPDTGQAFAVDRAPATAGGSSDELDLLRPGGDYGFDPSLGGTAAGYDAAAPMTDLERFPDAVRPVWQSARPPVGAGAATFLAGNSWGPLRGALAVATEGTRQLLLLGLDPDGAALSMAVPAELNGTAGRLRGARLGPDDALYLAADDDPDAPPGTVPTGSLLGVTPAG